MEVLCLILPPSPTLLPSSGLSDMLYRFHNTSRRTSLLMVETISLLADLIAPIRQEINNPRSVDLSRLEDATLKRRVMKRRLESKRHPGL